MITDLDERLKRILSGSLMMGPKPAKNPDEGMGLEEIRAFGANMTEGAGEELPKGTKVVFAEEEPEVSAPPPRQPLRPAPVLTSALPPEKEVDLSGQPRGDIEEAYARAQDREARRKMSMERGGRELVAGLTRTQAQPVVQRPVDAFDRFVAKRKSQSDVAAKNEAGRLGAAKFNFDTKEAARKAAEDKARDERDFGYREKHDKDALAASGAAFEETKRHNVETEKSGRISALKPSAGVIAERRQEMRENAIKPRGGWEPIDPAAPTFRDPDQAKKFDNSVAAMGAIRNHRDHVLHGLEELKKAKTPAEVDVALAKINAQMGALASKLRDAEGLNNTDASNHAVDTMLSLTNGSIVNLKNLANEGRLPAILSAAINSGEANLDTLAESANLRRSKKTGGAAPAAAPTRKTLKGGAVVEKHEDGLWYPVEE